MASPDHYRTLHVARFAPQRNVRRAFIALMRHHHAARDRGDAGAEHAIREIGTAYWHLRHPERRARYDEGLREAERQRAAARRRATAMAAVRRPVRERPATRLVFALSLAGLAAGVVWASGQRPAWQGAIAALTDPAPSIAEGPEIGAAGMARIDRAFIDYQAMLRSGGRADIARYVARCFAEMRTGAPLAVFDYCVALEGFAADVPLNDGQDRFFSRSARRARLRGVALAPADAAQRRWDVIDQLVSTRSWPSVPAASDPAVPAGDPAP